MAIATMISMIATTIKSSIRENPRFELWVFLAARVGFDFRIVVYQLRGREKEGEKAGSSLPPRLSNY